MKIPIELIRTDEKARIRKETGNIKLLEESIAQVGLINPILIDEQNNLIAGFRRLTACRNLGWTEVEVKIVSFAGDELKMLEAEVAENLFRKDFTAEEVLATERRRLAIIESRRKKGFFERLWLWLKKLFGGSPEKSEHSPVAAGIAEVKETVVDSRPTGTGTEPDGGQAAPDEKEQQPAPSEEAGDVDGADQGGDGDSTAASGDQKDNPEGSAAADRDERQADDGDVMPRPKDQRNIKWFDS